MSQLTFTSGIARTLTSLAGQTPLPFLHLVYNYNKGFESGSLARLDSDMNMYQNYMYQQLMKN